MISHTAIVSPHAKLGSNVTIGNYSIIKDHVVIGDNSVIGDFCLLGEPVNNADKPLIIGKNAYIRSHSIFYQSAAVGNYFVCGHNVHIREKTNIGHHCQIGSNSDLQGNLEFGNFSRTQSNVFIGKYSKIEKFVWILPSVSLLNDITPPSDSLQGPTIKSFAVLCANSIIMPNITVEKNCVIGANSLVASSTNADYLYLGSPAKKIKKVNEIYTEEGRSAYPWTKRFFRGYPEEEISKW